MQQLDLFPPADITDRTTNMSTGFRLLYGAPASSSERAVGSYDNEQRDDSHDVED